MHTYAYKNLDIRIQYVHRYVNVHTVYVDMYINTYSLQYVKMYWMPSKYMLTTIILYVDNIMYMSNVLYTYIQIYVRIRYFHSTYVHMLTIHTSFTTIFIAI